jgi:hypothetical protein
VPFLAARDDKTRFPGIESASTDIYSRFGQVRSSSQIMGLSISLLPLPPHFLRLLTTAQGAITPAAFALLLRDAATLLRPPLIAVEENEECVPALRALSDLHALFEPHSPRTAAKIMFYAAQVHRTSESASFLLRGLQADVERWAEKLEKEEGEEEDQKWQGFAADHGIRSTPP